MTSSPEQIASDWITFTEYSAGKAPDDIFALGWALYDAAKDSPALAWDVIKKVIFRYSEEDLFSATPTDAQRMIGNTAAGPLEELLANFGAEIIDVIEAAARGDRRVFWALGCVWQNSMTDEIWARVQSAAGNISR